MLALKKKHRVAVAWAQDVNSIGAINKAVKKGLIEAILIGNPLGDQKDMLRSSQLDDKNFTLIETENEISACAEAVRLTKIRRSRYCYERACGNR